MRSLLCLAALAVVGLARHHHHQAVNDEGTTTAGEKQPTQSVSAADLIKQGKKEGKPANDWGVTPGHPGWGNSGVNGGSSGHPSWGDKRGSSHPSSHPGYPDYYYGGGHGSGPHGRHGRRGRHHGRPSEYYYYPSGHHGGRRGHHGDPHYYPGYYGEFHPVPRGRGSKHARCGHGYYWDEHAWKCLDIDECDHQQQSLCPYGRTCVNIPGSYRCVKRHHGHHGGYGPPPDKDDEECTKPTCASIGMKVEENCEVYADGEPYWSITMSEKTKLGEDDCCLLCRAQHGCIYAEYKEATKHHEGYCQMYKAKENPSSKSGDYTCMYFD